MFLSSKFISPTYVDYMASFVERVMYVKRFERPNRGINQANFWED
jgi:hypothetical protein